MPKSKTLEFFKDLISEVLNSQKGVMSILLIICIAVIFLTGIQDVHEERERGKLTTLSSSVDPKLSKIIVTVRAETNLINNIQCIDLQSEMVTVPQPRQTKRLPEYLDSDSFYKDYPLTFDLSETDPTSTTVNMPMVFADIVRGTVPESQFKADMQVFYNSAASRCTQAFANLYTWPAQL